ncbi:MAG: AsmA-like C-terminal domain-containing protein [Desulfobacterales bacterium]|jgi:hypothetical protein
MNIFRKINNRLINSLLIFGVLVIVVLIIVPQLINLEMMREYVENTISNEINGEINYRHLDLAYFPRPHVVVHSVEILIPDSFTIKMQRMKIYPKILSLFLGRLRAKVVILEYADYFMQLPQIGDDVPKIEQPASFEDILAAIFKAIRGLPEFKLPELKLRVNSGNINLVDPFGREFRLRSVQAAYQRRPQKLDFSIRCKSNLWDQIDVNGSLNPLDFKGKGHIRLSQFRPQVLMAYLLHDSALQVTDSKVNFSIDLELDGTGNLKAVVDGTVPLLALSHGEEQLIIKGGRIQGTVQIGDRKVTIDLTEMGLDYPKLEATGKFSYDENLPDIQLAVNGIRIDAAAVRQVALGLMGESKTIRNIFKIIRGGFVPWITVYSRGHNIAELGMMDNIVIKGQMKKGKIFIPGAELHLDGVIGDALISAGILHGENLEAQLGNTSGRDGNLTIGLNRDLAPFHLNIDINADLSQLPPVLGRVVKNKDFSKELGLVYDVKGTATGVLILGDDLANLNAEVAASNIHLAARYKRLQYPIEIDGGYFNYGKTRLAFKNFNANIGKSSLSISSLVADWTEKPNLNVISQSAKINLNELYSFLRPHVRLKKIINNFSILNGEASIDSLEIKGPFFSPRNWRFKTRGVVNNLTLASDKIPKSLKIGRGHFKWQGTKVKFSDMDVSLGSSKILQLSAGADLGKSSTFEVHSQSAELVADELYPWLLTLVNGDFFLKDFSVTKGRVILAGLDLSGPLNYPAQWHYTLTGDLKNLVITSDAFGDPLAVNSGSFDLISETMPNTTQNKIRLNTIELVWGKNRLTLVGTINLSPNDTLLDLALTANALDWDQVNHIVDYVEAKSKDSTSRPAKRALRGTLKVQADSFNYETFAVNPLKADLSFKPDKMAITINEAVICSISFQGRLNVNSQTLEINLVPTAVNQMLDPAVSCITDQKQLATGTFNLNGQLLSNSKPEEFLRSLSGEVVLSAEKGRINRLGLLAKILSILNVTEIYRGEIPDLTGKGFAYHGLKISANLEGSKLVMQECAIDGVSMGIACEGHIDLSGKKMNLIILVAPFKTVDRIVKVLPLLKHVLGGKLISIPFRAKGDIADPEVIPLPPTAIGAGVLGILERTLKLPITIMQPVFSSGKNKKNDQSLEENSEPSELR